MAEGIYNSICLAQTRKWMEELGRRGDKENSRKVEEKERVEKVKNETELTKLIMQPKFDKPSVTAFCIHLEGLTDERVQFMCILMKYKNLARSYNRKQTKGVNLVRLHKRRKQL